MIILFASELLLPVQLNMYNTGDTVHSFLPVNQSILRIIFDIIVSVQFSGVLFYSLLYTVKHLNHNNRVYTYIPGYG